MVALSRRAVLGGLAILPSLARADAVVELEWPDLLPKGEVVVPNMFQGLIDHDGPPMSSAQPISSGVRSDWAGMNVRLPGFIVPIEHQGSGVISFILVPYVGACVHVPPPPANQLVFVTTDDPYESSGMFEPVHVTGRLGISLISTEIADVGYTLNAQKIEKFRL